MPAFTDDHYDFPEMRRRFVGALDTETDQTIWMMAVSIISTLNGLCENPSDQELITKYEGQMDEFEAYLISRNQRG